MALPAVDRRKHRHFRFLYMNLDDFVHRFILGRLAPAGAPKPQAVPVQEADPGFLEPPEPGVPKLPFRTGIDLIDKQHSELLGSIQDLRQAMLGQAGQPGITQALGFLERYTDEHFAYEEAYLEHIHYPGLERHRAEHAYFRQQIQQIQTRAAAKEPATGLELSVLLFKWLQNHILLEDFAYTEFVHLAKAKR